MVVKRVGMSTTPLGMYLQIKNHHEQHPKIERHLQCAHRKDFKKPRGTDCTNENLCGQDRFGGGDSSSKSPADLFIVTAHSLTQSNARSYLRAREDSFEMTSIRRNSSFYTLATVQRLGRFANRNSETSTETGRGRVRGAKQNGAFSRKSIRTFGSRALEPNKIFGSVQPGRFESAHVAMCFGSFTLGLQDAASTSALFASSSVMSSFSRSSSSTASISSSPAAVCSPAPKSRLLRNHRSLPRRVS